MKKTVTLQVKCKNKTDFFACIALFYAMGFPYNEDTTYEDIIKEDFYGQGYTIPFIDTDEMDFNSKLEEDLTTYYWSKDLDAIIEHLSTKTYRMNLTNQYDAEITSDGIIVGCQTITFEKFEELSALVEKYKTGV